MFEIICGNKKWTTPSEATATKIAREKSIDEFDTAYIFGDDPQNPDAEYYCGQRVDEPDSKTLKIGK